MMKMLSLVLLMALAAAAFSPSAKGDEPPIPQVPTLPKDIKLTPEMQATFTQLLKMLNTDQGGNSDAADMTPLVAQLLKMLNTDKAGTPDITRVMPMVSQLLKMLDMESTDESKPANPSGNSDSAPTASSGGKSQQTGLQTNSLRSGGLVTSTLNGIPRLTNEQWRELFPAKQAGK